MLTEFGKRNFVDLGYRWCTSRLDCLVDSMILVDGEKTGGHLGLIRDVVPAGHTGQLLHLAGELVFCVGDKISTVKAGEVALARRGEPHTFANRTKQDVPVLMFVTPAGFEQHFADGAAQARPPQEYTVVVGGRLDDEQ